MIAVLLYIVGGFLIMVLYRKKIETHLRFLWSIDVELKKFHTIFDLSKSQNVDHKFMAVKVMLPLFYFRPNQILTEEQNHLKRNVSKAVIKLYSGVALMIVFFEVWFRIL